MKNNKLVEEAEFHSFGWYAARVSPHMPKKAFKAVPGRLWGGLIYAFIALGGIFSIAFFDLNIWLNLLIAVILGSSFASLGFLGHEILHGTVVRKRWLRNVLGAIAFWPLTTGPELWKKWHNMEHHHHTQDEHKDPDAWPTVNKLAKSRFLRWMYRIPFTIRAMAGFAALAFTFTLHSSHMFITYIKDFNKEKQIKVWMQFIMPWATWIGLLLWIGPVKWLFAFFLPLLIANFIVMAYISTNHRLNPLVPVNDPLANSLTVTVPKWVDVLHFNFSYHTEHHLFPGMNPKYYPIVKRRIKEMWPERYHEMPMSKAMRALWKTPRVYFDQDQLVDPNNATAFGSLGNGLDPNNIKSREVDLSQLSLKGKKNNE